MFGKKVKNTHEFVELFVDVYRQASSDRRHVVGKQKALLFGRSFKDYGVACTGKADILNADNIDVRPATEQTANDIVIEVLVSGQEQHSAYYSPTAWRARRRSRMPIGSNLASFCSRTNWARRRRWSR